jgi:hypothetical protein
MGWPMASQSGLAGGIAQLGQAGATEQWTERRIAERSFVELDDMGVAAGVLVK